MSTKRRNILNPKMAGAVVEVMRKYVKVKLDNGTMWRVHPAMLQVEK